MDFIRKWGTVEHRDAVLVLRDNDPAIHQIVDAISAVLKTHPGVVSVAHIYALREFRAVLPARGDGPTLPGVG